MTQSLQSVTLWASIVSALVMAFIYAIGIHLIKGGHWKGYVVDSDGRETLKHTFLRNVQLQGWGMVLITGLIYWMILYLSPQLSITLPITAAESRANLAVAIMYYVFALAMMSFMIFGWRKRKGYGWEIVPLSWTAFSFASVAQAPASVLGLVAGGGNPMAASSVFYVSLFSSIAWAMLVIVIGYFVVSMLYNYSEVLNTEASLTDQWHETRKMTEQEVQARWTAAEVAERNRYLRADSANLRRESKTASIVGRVVFILAIVGVLAILIFGALVKIPAAGSNASATEQRASQVTAAAPIESEAPEGSGDQNDADADATAVINVIDGEVPAGPEADPEADLEASPADEPQAGGGMSFNSGDEGFDSYLSDVGGGKAAFSPDIDLSLWNVRHLLVMNNDAKEDDDDFGPNPLDEILAEKVTSKQLTVKDLANKSERELYELVTPEEIFDKLVEELIDDPIKGAALMGDYDVVHGTNFLGDFSTELKDHPDELMRRINSKAREWLVDPDEYMKVLTAFVATLELSDEMVITYQTSGLDDQMYMFGVTPDHVPIVIVMESKDHGGFALTFRDYLKGSKTTVLEVSYRINCDFQPTNIGEKAVVTVWKQPGSTTPGSGGNGGNGGGQSGGGQSGGGYRATMSTGMAGGGKNAGGSVRGGGSGGGGNYAITNPKDPTKGTPVGPNDTKGPGEDTNTGYGSVISAKDEPTNSRYMDLDEYWDAQYELFDQRDDNPYGQREAGDSNAPTVPTPAGYNVDGNAVSGTGYGGADVGSQTSAEITYQAPNGTNQSFANEASGEEWELGS